MSDIKDKLDNALENGKKDGLYTSIGASWEEVKQNLGSYIGYFLVYILIQGAMVLVSIQTYFLFSILATILQPIFNVGFIYYYKKAKEGNDDFSSFFEGFQDLGRYLSFGVLLSLLNLVVTVVPDLINGRRSIYSSTSYEDFLAIAESSNSNPNTIITLMISLFTLLVLPIMAYNKELGVLEAITYSIKAVSKNALGLIGYSLLLLLVIIVSAIPCGIGLLFTFPMIYVSVAIIYERIFGITSRSDEILEEFGESEEE